MKAFLKIIIISASLLVLLLSITPSFAQEPPHPPSTGHGQIGNQQPGGAIAPIDGGLSILLMLSFVYGAKNAYSSNREK
jgi:hypothetical protein